MSDTVEILTTAAPDLLQGALSRAGVAGLGEGGDTSPPSSPLSAEMARELFTYNPSTGILANRVRRGTRGLVGAPVGSDNGRGHLIVKVGGRNYLVHRLIWLVVHGRWPADELDHIDGNPANNALDNLREATRAQNAQNKVGENGAASRFIGVSWHSAASKWRAEICASGQRFSLGVFASEAEAYAAYCDAKALLHEFNPVPRDLETHDGGP
jgi:hypothetical protein